MTHEAVGFLRGEIARGGDFRFTGPIGAGKCMIVAHALVDYTEPVIALSRREPMTEQFREICSRAGANNVEHRRVIARKDKLDEICLGYNLVVLQEDMKSTEIDHPNILRIV